MGPHMALNLTVSVLSFLIDLPPRAAQRESALVFSSTVAAKIIASELRRVN
jgi:hypothetical protein